MAEHKSKLTKTRYASTRALLCTIAFLLTANFTFSLYLWFGSIKARVLKNLPYWPEVAHAFITLLLWSISVTALLFLLSKRRRARRSAAILLSITLILSTCCFIYDTHCASWAAWRIPIFVSGPEPYQGIGWRFYFVNWPWYVRDVITAGASTEPSVFHHFFGHRPKGYISSSTLTYIGDPNSQD